MQRCLDLAVRGAGAVSPNPMVGAVVVGSGGEVLGEGWHERYGGPHAERQAVAEVERRYGASVLREATLYVNLEPCNHHGKQPPCTDLILEKAIPRVVVGMVDPFPAVAGGGIARLREHGVAVTVGVLEAACWRLNEAFVHHVTTGRPLVTLKIAQTLDGRIATATGDSRWVSGPEARALVHRWRARLDGVLVGSGTARMDDPALTVRHVGGRQPVRLVLDRTGTLPPGLQVFTDAWVRHTTAVVAPGAAPAYAEALQASGGRLLTVPEVGGHLDLPALLAHLGREGGRDGLPLQSLLVEAGPGLATALMRQDLVDRLYLFIAPKLVGDGRPAFGALGIERMREALGFAESAWEPVGEDLLFRGYRRAAPGRRTA
ncbi:MAG: bifunctional diaminohydroxyphosphoribosylaminopyrimidine deaminase/5-amino-6-(5-phosphoribosylamino)uracil reductase RibD [Bacteroidetes bacterium]|nr:MAG: bifunctional diaminohydroxyphosphoribosylaminopyrimidine deaminase/5-amino-6-(5-phosphoribosylamino)uracil reductase RibD [Bacteroidota bacterium]